MTKWKNRSRQGQSKRGRYDGKGTPGSIASCQRAGPVRGSSPWGAKEAKSAPGHGGGGARGRPAPPKARPLPLPARPRRSRKRGGRRQCEADERESRARKARRGPSPSGRASRERSATGPEPWRLRATGRGSFPGSRWAGCSCC